MSKWKKKQHSTNLELYNLTLSIHKYIGYGEQLFLSVPQIRIIQKKLDCIDIELAKKKSIIIVKELLEKMIKDINEFE